MKIKNLILIPLLTICLALSSGCGSASGKAGADSSSENTASANDADSGSDTKTGSNADPDTARDTVTEIKMTTAPGDDTFEENDILLDYSNAGEGYIMIQYSGASQKVQVQITDPSGNTVPYPLKLSSLEAFPLTGGSGTYKVEVLTEASADMYSIGLSQEITAEIKDELSPYLYPNQYVDYTEDSGCVSLGISLSDESSDDLSYVEKVYDYVIENISYDDEKAASLSANYIPDPDETLSEGKGICFDYASLMSSMLRSQAIPTRLEVGYSGEVYHAWISVYLTESGWVDDVIEFDGNTWTLMDPTLASTNDAKAVKKYVGDGSNYTVLYYY